MISTRHYQPGDIIVKEKDPGETAYIIRKGRVRVDKEVAGKKIHICDLEAGNIFGEMSMIDEKPRSATVTALEETVVNEIHRNKFFLNLKKEEELALKILKILFERLRKADITITQLKAEGQKTEKSFFVSLDAFPVKPGIEVYLEGLTKSAARNLPENPFHIEKFPFLIGRKSNDPLSHNDLSILDKPPHRISKHHLQLDLHGAGISVLDRGSHLGSIVDGRQLGGHKGNPGPLVFEKEEVQLVLGDEGSPYKYKILMKVL